MGNKIWLGGIVDWGPSLSFFQRDLNLVGANWGILKLLCFNKGERALKYIIRIVDLTSLRKKRKAFNMND
jgi:hypothetical protein